MPWAQVSRSGSRASAWAWGGMAVIDSGTGSDLPESLTFSVLAGRRSLSAVFLLERVAAAYERMMSGKARFRFVINSGQ